MYNYTLLNKVDYERRRFRFAEMDYDATNKQIHIMEYERDENARRRDIFQEWIYFTTVSHSTACYIYNDHVNCCSVKDIVKNTHLNDVWRQPYHLI